MLHIKNPWNRGRWKGRWSPDDLASWTPSMCKKLGYDPIKAQAHDDGEFWMDLPSVKNFFDIFHMNWNPDLFKYKYDQN